jgi:hypothetical protein
MIINYSAHSLERIRERELSKEKVEIVISNPDSLVQIEELKKALSNLMIASSLWSTKRLIIYLS